MASIDKPAREPVLNLPRIPSLFVGRRSPYLLDDRPLNVKLATTAGILAVPAPFALIVVAWVEHANPAGMHSSPLAVLFGFCFVTGILGAIFMAIAIAANPRLNLHRPDFGEYLAGLIMAPVLVIANLTVVVLTALFIAAAISGFLFLLHHV